MANGKVCTGFSYPVVALYGHTGSTVTYTNGQPLARGVSVQVSPEASDDNNFYADNVVAESAAGRFSGGEVTLTVDGLKAAARRLIHGLPAAGADGFVAFGNDSVTPYCGAGWIARFMEAGVTTYVPTVLTKVMFAQDEDNAATQEEDIDWQTSELKAKIFRDDSANQNWKFVHDTGFEDEADAIAALNTKLGISG